MIKILFNKITNVRLWSKRSFIAMFGVALLVLNPSLASAQDDELLPSEEAFAFEAKMVEGAIEAKWTVADGYYMYQDKLSFTLSDSDGQAIEIDYSYPEAKIKEDPIFGTVAVYVKHVDFSIPVSSPAGKLILSVKGQGCNEPVGVCYPPIRHEVSLENSQPLAMNTGSAFNPLSSSSQISNEQLNEGGLNSIDELRSLLGGSLAEDELLPVDEAFKIDALSDEQGVHLRFEVADGYYLYQNKLKFSSPTHVLAKPELPEGTLKQDAYFGEVVVYKHGFDALLKLAKANDNKTLELEAEFQGCAEAGVCYPPQKESFTLTLADIMPIASAQAALAGESSPPSGDIDNKAALKEGELVSEQDKLANSLKEGNIWFTLLIFFGAGLLLAFTPCVFPMIPILSGIIVGQGEDISTKKAFYLSLVFVLSMALTYTVVGVLVGLSGQNIQAWFQNPWIIGSFVAIFVALSFSMFGFYELQMPTGIQNKITKMSNSQQGGNLVGVAIMGFLSALIVGPCVTAPLVGALIYIAETGDALFGGMALFSLSMGMGAPLLLIGASAGKILPKAGRWMDSVKAVFGVGLLGLAIWMLERVAPVFATMSLWAILLIVSAVYMGALTSLDENNSGWKKLWKGLGLVVLAYGLFLLVGMAGGNRSVFQPLKGLGLGANISAEVNAGQNSEHLAFIQVKGVDGLNKELEKAKAAGKRVMLDFYADWCVSCKEMEALTFSDVEVQKALEGVVLLQADVTPNDEIDTALYKRFKIIGPPSIMFFDLNGEERKNYRVVGFMSAKKFGDHVKRALN